MASALAAIAVALVEAMVAEQSVAIETADPVDDFQKIAMVELLTVPQGIQLEIPLVLPLIVSAEMHSVEAFARTGAFVHRAAVGVAAGVAAAGGAVAGGAVAGGGADSGAGSGAGRAFHCIAYLVVEIYAALLIIDVTLNYIQWLY